jgi:hypothetical protein
MLEEFFINELENDKAKGIIGLLGVEYRVNG